MATSDQPTPEPNQALDPAQLGADAQPATTARDDAHDMSSVMADADTDEGRPFAGEPTTRQGSAFDMQRQQGATNDAPTQDVGHGQGMGRAQGDGDEDRGYDQSGLRGGLGSSGGREDLSERQTDTGQNPFSGGSGGSPNQPPAAQTKQLGLNTPQPTDD
ncbi:MAG: hypothetical protein EOO56_10755, partial [Hymenobacter sp.]